MDRIRPNLATALVVLVLSVFGVFVAFLTVAVGLTGAMSLEQAAQFADSFGLVTAAFSALSLLLIIYTVVMQQKELALQRDEMTRMVAIQAQAMRTELFALALHDPDLIEVQGRPDPGSKKAKQLLYANMSIHNLWTTYMGGMLSTESLEAEFLLRFRRSAIYREYWEASKDAWAHIGTGDPKELFHDPALSDRFRDLGCRAWRQAIEEMAQSTG